MDQNAPRDPVSLWIPDTSSALPLPAGWTGIEEGGVPLARGPEGDVEVGFLVRPAEASDGETVAAAWRALSSHPELESRREQAIPPTEGWERAHQFIYRVRGRDDHVALALLRVAGDCAFVNLIVASHAGLDRRAAQVMQLIQGWRPQGLEAEDLSGRQARPWSDRDSEELERFIREGMDALGIPGVALAVVQGGRTVECRGFGRCAVDAADPVTGDTLFMIGSSTKALTTLMMARLIGAGCFTWSTPVLELMPGFAFADREMTRRLQMRHTVSASTGMPRSDAELIFQADGVDPECCLERMKRLQPTTGFGETFQYSNQLVALGGFAAAKAAAPGCGLAEAYRRVMQEQVFGPLGMDHTLLERPETGRALAHAPNMQGLTQPIDMRIERFVEAVAPSGALWSSARDLACYLRTELAGGLDAEGRRYLDRDLLRQRYEPQVRIGRDSSYGLGLIRTRESGLDVLGHGGNTAGFTSDVWFMPECDLGVVVLTNLARVNDFTAAIGQKFRELLFDAEPKSGDSLSIAVRARETATKSVCKRISTDAEAQNWISPFEGTYLSDELGRADIELTAHGHQIRFKAWSSALGVETADDGLRRLALVSAPFSGSLLLRPTEDGNTLVLATGGQQQHVFRRQSAQCAPVTDSA
jgi:CubicO group peptidase (beta-lactamase class C family)